MTNEIAEYYKACEVRRLAALARLEEARAQLVKARANPSATATLLCDCETEIRRAEYNYDIAANTGD